MLPSIWRTGITDLHSCSGWNNRRGETALDAAAAAADETVGAEPCDHRNLGEAFAIADVALTLGHEVRVVPATLVNQDARGWRSGRLRLPTQLSRSDTRYVSCRRHWSIKTLGVGDRGVKNDRKDARKLRAQGVSCRIDLPSVHVPSELARRLKSACGNREELVECRTKRINNVRGWLRTQLGRIRTGGTETFAARVRSHATEQNPLPEYIERTLTMIEALTDQTCNRSRLMSRSAHVGCRF